MNVASNSKLFGKKHWFSNKHAKSDSNIKLIEKDEILLKNKKIAEVLNSYLDSVTNSLDNENIDGVKNISKRFHNQPIFIRIKLVINNQAKFSFQPASVHTVKEVIEGLPPNKAIAVEIPIKSWKKVYSLLSSWLAAL